MHQLMGVFLTGLSYVLQQPPTAELAKTKADIPARSVASPLHNVHSPIKKMTMTIVKLNLNFPRQTIKIV